MYPAYLAIVMSQVLCCRLVLNLKGARDALVHGSGPQPTQHQSFVPGPVSRTGGHSIALRRYNPQTFNDQADLYDTTSMKVQVSISPNCLLRRNAEKLQIRSTSSMRRPFTRTSRGANPKCERRTFGYPTSKSGAFSSLLFSSGLWVCLGLNHTILSVRK